MTKYFGGVNPVRSADKARTVVLLSVFCLLVFSFIAFQFLYVMPQRGVSQQVVIERDAPVEMEEVLIPVQKIEGGMPLEPSMFRKERRPKVGLSVALVRDFEEIRGHYSRSLIASDQPLHNDYITVVKPTNAITANIPEGFRAVTIHVDATSSVEGWARPGARVDVAWTSTVRGENSVTVIVQNVKVLSAERQMDGQLKPGQPIPSTVTLLVSERDSERVQLAQTTGALSLLLRGDNDSGKAGANSGGTITTRHLLGLVRDDGNGNVEGAVKVKAADGTYSEYILRNGKLVPR